MVEVVKENTANQSSGIDCSIIIPVYNDADAFLATYAMLQKQKSSYSFEVILVDNGSNAHHVKLIQAVEGIRFIQEKEHLNSPYSCRNRGIELARGNYIILLDSTCSPEFDWLEKGMKCLIEGGQDIIGGNVLFDFEGHKTAAKVYDSLNNIRMKESIEERGAAKTANLFIKREVFDQVGMFPEGIRSGADVRWTGMAVKKGMKLAFCEQAIIYKKARGFRELMIKQWRIGIHQPLVWKEEGRDKSFFKQLFQFFLPVKLSTTRKILKEQGKPEDQKYLFSLLWINQLVKWWMILANLNGYIRFRKELKEMEPKLS